MSNTASGKPTRARRVASARMPVMAATPPLNVDAIGAPSTVLGRITAISAEGVVMLSLAGQAPITSLVLGHISAAQLSDAFDQREPVLVTFPDGANGHPVIVGVVASKAKSPRRPTTATVDGRRVEITGHDEVVLTCGEASITLTKVGKVLIKGVYVSTAADEVNRITGGSVKIN